MKPRVIAAVSVIASCCSPRLRWRKASCRAPDNCRRPAAKAARRRADRPAAAAAAQPPRAAKPYKPVAISAPAAGHRSELRGVPQAARRGRREEGSQGARRPRGAELLLDGREGRQGRQEKARHRQSRQGDPARRQGGAGLGDARRAPPAIRPARRFRIARTRSARRPIRPSMRRSSRRSPRRPAPRKATGPIRPRPASRCTRARSPIRRWSRSSACISCA